MREKLGLDPLRKQLLETALQGKEAYEEVEAEALRLFKDLAVSDPLVRRLGLEQKGRGRGPGSFHSSGSSFGTRSWASSASGPRASSSAASSTFSHGGKGPGRDRAGMFTRRSPPTGRPRQTYVAEYDDEALEDIGGEDEELVADEGEGPNLDEVLESEAQALAAELEAAEQEGIDPTTLEEIEGSVETAAEALITMRDAKTKLQEVRRDRGFGKAGATGPSAGKGGNPAFKKKGVCHDCGLPGHWAGDAACGRPGAGLARPKGGGRGAGSPASGGTSPTRRVQLVETMAAETVAEEGEQVHEASVVTNLKEALETSEMHEALAGMMAKDKKNVGALDSACNRTVCGRAWLDCYLSALRRAPSWKVLSDLVATEVEKETFKFGNDGTKASRERHRLPMVVGGSLILVWASVVEVDGLGLLLGRDFLEAIGGVISFTRRALRADYLDAKRIPLKQLTAGHFFLDVFPAGKVELDKKGWTRQGQDGVIEVQVRSGEWQVRKAAALKPGMSHVSVHEQLASEAIPHVVAGDLSSNQPVPPMPLRSPNLSPDARERREPKRKGVQPISPHVPKSTRPKSMAFRWCAALAAAAAGVALRATTVQQCQEFGGVATASRKHGEEPGPPKATLPQGGDGGQVFGPGPPEGLHVPPRPPWHQAVLPGGPAPRRDACDKGRERSKGSCSRAAGGEAQGGGGDQAASRRGPSCSKVSVGTKRGSADLEARPYSVGDLGQCAHPEHRHRGQVKGEAEAHGGDAQGDAQNRPYRRRSRPTFGLKSSTSSTTTMCRGAASSYDSRPNACGTAPGPRHPATGSGYAGRPGPARATATHSPGVAQVQVRPQACQGEPAAAQRGFCRD